MNRLLAIALIAIHLVNTIGGYVISARLEAVHEQKVSTELDQDEYVGSDAITLRIPFSLPYSSINKNYERISGKIEYESQHYYMIKHKFYNDTLFIVCLKDRKLTEIKEVFKNLAASVNDTHKNESSGKTIINLQIRDFERCTPIQLRAELCQLETIELPRYTFSVIINSDFPLLQPPRV